MDLDSQIQGLVTCIHANSISRYFAGGLLYTASPAYHFGGEREGVRVAQVCPRSEDRTLGGEVLSGMVTTVMWIAEVTSTLAVLHGILSGISKAHTALFPLFILEWEGARVAQVHPRSHDPASWDLAPPGCHYQTPEPTPQHSTPTW